MNETPVACCRCDQATHDFYRRNPGTGKLEKRAWCKFCYELLAAIAQWSSLRPNCTVRARWIPDYGKNVHNGGRRAA